MTVEKHKTIPDFIESLGDDKKEQVELLRNTIKSLDVELTEHIKWNAPSYVLNGEDRITFNLINKDNLVKLVIHMGAIRKEDRRASPLLAQDEGIVQWNSDIRGTITFNDLEDMHNKSVALKSVLLNWLAISH